MSALELVATPTFPVFERVVAAARREVICCAPYVGDEPCRRIDRIAAPGVSLMVACDLRFETVVAGVTRPEALKRLVGARPSASVIFAPGVHAKVFVADDAMALITSANLTFQGMCRNFEYGVLVTERAKVRQIRHDLTRFIAQGTPVNSSQLTALIEARDEYLETATCAQTPRNNPLDVIENPQADRARDMLLRWRAAGRAPHAIFADAIEYLLAEGPLTTKDLHERIRSLHPDFCDDTVDRVIDGKHFGKKWKHAVRTAQQMLKKQGRIRLDGVDWSLAVHD